MDSTGGTIWGLALVTLLFLSYFLPAFVAYGRESENVGLVFVLNLLLGWTVVGWFAVLLMAALGQTKAQRRFYDTNGRPT